MGDILKFYCFSIFFTIASAGMLKVQESESRTIMELNGMWNFKADTSANRNRGIEQKWWEAPLKQTGNIIPMPVPSSYNDITTDRSLQYFTGWVWYDREFFVSKSFTANNRIVLRIDSAHYYSMVWINGEHVMDHNGGHLPFEAEVGHLLKSADNRITVAVNNTLTKHTLPPGSITFQHSEQYPPGYFVQNLQFDFFNYAGIHRRVRLYTTPKQYIEDVNLVTSISGTTGMVRYNIITGDGSTSQPLAVEVLDMDGNVVTHSDSYEDTLTIPNAKLWWPFSMSKANFTNMYTLKASLTTSSGDQDVYRLQFGIRTVSVTKTQLLINNKPFYCQGVAKHEDSDIRGKGLDFPLIARDFNMLRWLGADCFRTSHYPYAEEILDEADRWGIAVIDECPGVGIKSENMDNVSLAHHLNVMTELVTRDKNRPSVIMWSVANEPQSASILAKDYFKSVISHTKSLDSSRPVTFVSSSDYNSDKAAEFTDLQCFNRYYGWYDDTGRLDTISYKLSYDLDKWYETLQKPLIITEYGADTVAGLHTLPSFVFTEEYQYEFLEEYHKVFDVYNKKFLVGEMVWNFADFMTDETVTRVVGNRKGLLTRQRQPKAAAHLIRRRYWSLINNSSYTDAHHHILRSKYSQFENLDQVNNDFVHRFKNRL